MRQGYDEGYKMKIFDLFSGCGGFRLAAELNDFKIEG